MVRHHLSICTRNVEGFFIWDLRIELKSIFYGVCGIYLLRRGVTFLKYLPDRAPYLGTGTTRSENSPPLWTGDLHITFLICPDSRVWLYAHSVHFSHAAT